MWWLQRVAGAIATQAPGRWKRLVTAGWEHNTPACEPHTLRAIVPFGVTG
jgi:hypothetical protein